MHKWMLQPWRKPPSGMAGREICFNGPGRSEAAHTTFTLELHDYLRLNEAGIRQAVNWLRDEIERDRIQPR